MSRTFPPKWTKPKGARRFRARVREGERLETKADRAAAKGLLKARLQVATLSAEAVEVLADEAEQAGRLAHAQALRNSVEPG